jgi:segregation and condensation protein B
MTPSADPPFESQPQGISLDELTNAFAKVMGVEPRRPAEPAAGPEQTKTSPEAVGAEGDSPIFAETKIGTVPQPAETPSEPDADDACPINPRTILEAMLFVGNRDNEPLSPRRAAELMRDVEVDEIPSLVQELNHRYDETGAPYQIVGEGDGYRLSLRDEFHAASNRFYGRVREARLSQAAIDVLALVAYRQPLTAEQIHRQRGRPSRHVLAHLVRRGLLRIERPDAKRRTPHYSTTERFLRLFNLESLDDLPRSEEPEPT